MVYITIARWNKGYTDYLEKRRLATSDAERLDRLYKERPKDDQDFLKMQEYGPFDILTSTELEVVLRHLWIIFSNEI